MQTVNDTGRIIGLLLVLQIVGGAVGNFVLAAPAFAAPGFLVNAAAHSLNVSLSVVVGLATGALTLGVAILAYPILCRHSLSMALWLFGIAAANFALGAVEQIAVLSLLSLSNAYTTAAAPDEALFQALRGVVAAARNWAHYVHLLVGGGVLLVLFGALWRCSLIPRALAAAGAVATLLQMLAVGMPLFGHRIVFPMLAPLGIVMIATAIWLLVKGFDERSRPPAPEVA